MEGLEFFSCCLKIPKPRKIIPELKEGYIKTYFMHTGDHQIAKELGLLELRRSWAETSADGSGRLTKHAPELEYPSLNAADIKQRLSYGRKWCLASGSSGDQIDVSYLDTIFELYSGYHFGQVIEAA